MGEDNSSTFKGIITAVVVALVAGGSSPWWYDKLFSKSSPTPEVTKADILKTNRPDLQTTATETAVLPDLLSYVAIWEAIPRLTSAGFGLPAVELKRDETVKFRNQAAPGGIVIGVYSSGDTVLLAGQSYPVTTPIRVRVQNDPSWNRPARLYSGQAEVNGLVDFIKTKEKESEDANRGINKFKNR